MNRRLSEQILEKSNDFINMHPDPAYRLSLTQYRFINSVLAMLNPREPENRSVVIPLSDFCKFMGIKQQRYTYLEPLITKLQDFKIRILSPDGTIDNINLFDRSKIGPTHPPTEISFFISESAKPFVFELNTYTKLNPNILMMFDSVYHIRLYELLKQFDGFRDERIFTIEEIKSLLGLEQDVYNGRFNALREKIIDPFCKAAVEFSDLYVKYKLTRANNKKVVAIKFEMESKKTEIALPSLVSKHNYYDYGRMISYEHGIKLNYIIEAVEFEFDIKQIEILIQDCFLRDITEEYIICQYIRSAYGKMEQAAEKNLYETVSVMSSEC